MIKLPDETEMKWRDLALQFDGHRMQAISLLKMIIKDASDDQYLSVRNFLKSGPLPGEEVLRNRIAEIAEVQRLNATAQPVSDGWVKCSDRMPLQHQSNRYVPLNLLLNERTVDQGGFDDGEFWMDGVVINSVTRWMPLPAAPGGQND